MALTFPESPTEGQIFRPGGGVPNYFYRGGAWIKKTGTALPFNLVINPSMAVSQQNGLDAYYPQGYGYAAGSTTNNWYAADGWASNWQWTDCDQSMDMAMTSNSSRQGDSKVRWLNIGKARSYAP